MVLASKLERRFPFAHLTQTRTLTSASLTLAEIHTGDCVGTAKSRLETF
jgi:hypothetical protein